MFNSCACMCDLIIHCTVFQVKLALLTFEFANKLFSYFLEQSGYFSENFILFFRMTVFCGTNEHIDRIDESVPTST